jgi:hypothetical protein
MLDIIDQNHKVIYVLSFETVAILTSCFFSFYNTNIKKFTLKNSFDPILSLNLNFKCGDKFAKEYQIDSYNFKKVIRKKMIKIYQPHSKNIHNL